MRVGLYRKQRGIVGNRLPRLHHIVSFSGRNQKIFVLYDKVDPFPEHRTIGNLQANQRVIENGSLVGIVAQADIALRENEQKTGELVEAISEPSEGERS